MPKPVEYIYSFFEKQAFGVCAWWGQMLGISSSRIRLYFIYISFITLGSPLILYLFMAFWKEYPSLFRFRTSRTVWDL